MKPPSPLGRAQRQAARRSVGLRLGVTAGLAVGLALSVPAADAATPTAVKGHPTKAAASRVTFGIGPASAKGSDGRPHFSFGATPGGVSLDHVAVLNYSSQPLSLQVYATDAINTANGGFGLLTAAQKPTGVGAWITLPAKQATVVVPAESAKAPGQVVVPFTLRVPADAQPGDHVGAIVASLSTEGHNKTGQDVILQQRVGTRVFLRVAGTLVPKVTVTGLHVTYHGALNPVGHGRATVSYTVHNTGNVELGLDQHVSISGLLGASHSVTLAAVPLLLPGDSLVETAQVGDVWPEIVAHAKVNARPVAEPGDNDPQLLTVSATTWTWAVPWTLIALLVLLVVAGRFGYVLVKLRRQPAPQSAQRERVKA